MKRRLKKITTVLLVIVMVISTMPFAVVTVSAVGTANDIVNVAQGEVGVSGRPNKYTYWLGTINGSYSYAWCHAFVSWCANQAGAGDKVPKTASCAAGVTWFKNRKEWKSRSSGYTPKAGDIIYFDYGASGTYDHVGIVTSSSGGRVYTIEGNARNAVKVNGGYSNGYSLNSTDILGYGVPSYGNAGNNPTGYVDSVTGGTGTVTVIGWAFDRDKLEQSLNIHVYIGGSSATPSAEVSVIKANASRKDVDNVHHVGEFHGFDATIPTTKTGNQDIYIYAINIGSGQNVEIGHSNVYISPDTDAPIVSDVTVSGISSYGYRVTCRVSDISGVSQVRFPTWTSGVSANWKVGELSGDTASVFIKASDYNNTIGSYYTDIYPKDGVGNETYRKSVTVTLTDTPEEKATGTYNGNTYKVFNSGMTWSDAKAWCEKNGGHLATVTTSAEWNALKNILKEFNGTRCWLGAEDTSGTWKWITGESFDFKDWAKNQPDGTNGTEHYLGSFGTGFIDCYQWNDYADNTIDVGGFVCEYENTVEPKKEQTIYYKGHTYEIYNSALSWNKAKDWCEQKGGHLATLTSRYEWKYLKEIISAKDNMNYWLGAEATSGTWKWVTGESFSFNNWGTGQPDNSGGNEKYLGSYYSGTDKDCIWNDFPVDYSRMSGFVCEYDGTTEPQKILEFSYNKHTYEVYNANLSWAQAKDWCKENGGNLAVVTDETEWNTIKSNLSDNLITRCWLGASCTSGKWEWVNGEEFNYNNWAESQPDNANKTEFYLGTFGTPLFDSYTWNDYTLTADDIGTFILEKEPEPILEYKVGDVDGDGEVTIIDATAIQRHLANIPVAAFSEKAADTDEDGKVTIIDATTIQRYLAQLSTNKNIGQSMS